jgi:plasmid stabilization system protein ParE
VSWPLIINPLAEDDMNSAKDWYDSRQIGLGDEFLAEVNATLNRLRAQPQVHQLVHGQLRRAVLKRFPYLVIYRIDPTQVTVVAVPHGRSDPSVWQSRA